ncbi:unnamed protein product [Chrysoparadoxa australica]
MRLLLLLLAPTLCLAYISSLPSHYARILGGLNVAATPDSEAERPGGRSSEEIRRQVFENEQGFLASGMNPRVQKEKMRAELKELAAVGGAEAVMAARSAAAIAGLSLDELASDEADPIDFGAAPEFDDTDPITAKEGSFEAEESDDLSEENYEDEDEEQDGPGAVVGLQAALALQNRLPLPQRGRRGGVADVGDRLIALEEEISADTLEFKRSLTEGAEGVLFDSKGNPLFDTDAKDFGERFAKAKEEVSDLLLDMEDFDWDPPTKLYCPRCKQVIFQSELDAWGYCGVCRSEELTQKNSPRRSGSSNSAVSTGASQGELLWLKTQVESLREEQAKMRLQMDKLLQERQAPSSAAPKPPTASKPPAAPRLPAPLPLGPDSPNQVMGMKVDELKARLKGLGLSSAGKKTELQKRLGSELVRMLKLKEEKKRQERERLDKAEAERMREEFTRKLGGG